MRDMSINLPYWAVHLGYTLEGNLGTFGDLWLKKNGEVTKYWRAYWDRAPDIMELEKYILLQET